MESVTDELEQGAPPGAPCLPQCDDHQLETVFKVLQVVPVLSHGPFSFLRRIPSS